MLARENRLTEAADFKAALKSGRKASTEHIVIYIKRVEIPISTRFGFLVSKLIGNAVKRNLVKRRLRELSRSYLSECTSSLVVIRALPGSAELTFDQLGIELEKAMQKLREK